MLNPHFYMDPISLVSFQFEGDAPISSLLIKHEDSTYDSVLDILDLKDFTIILTNGLINKGPGPHQGSLVVPESHQKPFLIGTLDNKYVVIKLHNMTQSFTISADSSPSVSSLTLKGASISSYKTLTDLHRDIVNIG
jgi:hypothetical protein